MAYSATRLDAAMAHAPTSNEKTAINAAIDTLGGVIDTQMAAATGSSEVEIEKMHDQLYELARLVGNALKDES